MHLPRQLLALAAMLFVIHVVIGQKDCGTGEGVNKVGKPNLCESEEGLPLCVLKPSKNNDTTDRVYHCSACDPTLPNKDCQCPVASYCVSDPANENYASCQPRDYAAYGKPCVPNIVPSEELKNEKMFCGKAIFKDKKLSVIEWQGSCVRGVCQECAVAGFLSYQSPICPDMRECLPAGYIVSGTARANSWSNLADNAISLLQAIWFLVPVPMLLTMAICWCSRSR